MAIFAFSDGNFYKNEINSAIFSKNKGKSYKAIVRYPLKSSILCIFCIFRLSHQQ